ncbi:MAG: hypothetical protein J6U01_06535 [Clostridia bacterium]|nr:hypothetical protein [Clostridia bacterium]
MIPQTGLNSYAFPSGRGKILRIINFLKRKKKNQKQTEKKQTAGKEAIHKSGGWGRAKTQRIAEREKEFFAFLQNLSTGRRKAASLIFLLLFDNMIRPVWSDE